MDASSLIEQLNAAAAKGPGAVQGDQRLLLIEAMNKLRDTIEAPLEKVLRYNWGAYDCAIFRLAIYMGLFDAAAEKNGPVTIQELAAKRNADPALVRRVVRALVHLQLFTQDSVDTFTATPMAAGYVTPSPLAQAFIHLSSTCSAALDMADYFVENGFKDVTDHLDGPWHYTHRNKGESYWEWQAKRPQIKEAFNTIMAMQKMVREEEWFEHWPVEEKLKLASDEQDRVVLVDVGGNRGHDLKLFHEALPNLPGKLVLEDMALVIDTITDLPSGIIPVAHDFFKPQPAAVKGAKAFYLRTVLHDWPDNDSLTILSHIKDAMAPDSLLLLNEAVLPETNVSYFDCVLDIHMMVGLSSRERTEKEWRSLLDKAGFEVKSISWPQKQGQNLKALIECVAKQ